MEKRSSSWVMSAVLANHQLPSPQTPKSSVSMTIVSKWTSAEKANEEKKETTRPSTIQKESSPIFPCDWSIRSISDILYYKLSKPLTLARRRRQRTTTEFVLMKENLVRRRRRRRSLARREVFVVLTEMIGNVGHHQLFDSSCLSLSLSLARSRARTQRKKLTNGTWHRISPIVCVSSRFLSFDTLQLERFHSDKARIHRDKMKLCRELSSKGRIS